MFHNVTVENRDFLQYARKLSYSNNKKEFHRLLYILFACINNQKPKWFRSVMFHTCCEAVEICRRSQLPVILRPCLTSSGTHSLLGRPGLLMYQLVRGTSKLWANEALRRGWSALLRKIFPKSCSCRFCNNLEADGWQAFSSTVAFDTLEMKAVLIPRIVRKQRF